MTNIICLFTSESCGPMLPFILVVSITYNTNQYLTTTKCEAYYVG